MAYYPFAGDRHSHSTNHGRHDAEARPRSLYAMGPAFMDRNAYSTGPPGPARLSDLRPVQLRGDAAEFRPANQSTSRETQSTTPTGPSPVYTPVSSATSQPSTGAPRRPASYSHFPGGVPPRGPTGPPLRPGDIYSRPLPNQTHPNTGAPHRPITIPGPSTHPHPAVAPGSQPPFPCPFPGYHSSARHLPPRQPPATAHSGPSRANRLSGWLGNVGGYGTDGTWMRTNGPFTAPRSGVSDSLAHAHARAHALNGLNGLASMPPRRSVSAAAVGRPFAAPRLVDAAYARRSLGPMNAALDREQGRGCEPSRTRTRNRNRREESEEFGSESEFDELGSETLIDIDTEDEDEGSCNCDRHCHCPCAMNPSPTPSGPRASASAPAPASEPIPASITIHLSVDGSELDLRECSVSHGRTAAGARQPVSLRLDGVARAPGTGTRTGTGTGDGSRVVRTWGPPRR
ncbi:hypothetical protein GGR54DRAFT_644367 [Hypoxylon sp. NC1633]|nr:hypothetical protein GGR54DRAFT_644367 [Hypoxylon sp. NC1633]